MVMGGGSCSEGCGFKSRGCILDGHDIFSHLFVVKNNNDVCLKRPKINKKRSGLAIFFKKSSKSNKDVPNFFNLPTYEDS